MEFKSSSEGARMLVSAGSRQSIGGLVRESKRSNTNMAAMVDAVQSPVSSTWTPLSGPSMKRRGIPPDPSTFATGYVYRSHFFSVAFQMV